MPPQQRPPAGGAREPIPRTLELEGRKTMVKDPVCGMNVDEAKAAATTVYRSQTYYFCSKGCQAAFEKAPEKYAV